LYLHLTPTPTKPILRPNGAKMKNLLLIIAAIIISGCATPETHFTPADNKKFEPYKGEVRLLDKMPEKKQYTVIGEIDAKAYPINPNDQIITYLKKEAAEHGANAIVLTHDITTKISFSAKMLVGLYDTPKNAQVTAIKIE
jgi:hypothetical protein